MENKSSNKFRLYKYDIQLSEVQRKELERIINDPDSPERQFVIANALLRLDKNRDPSEWNTMKDVSDFTGLSINQLSSLKKNGT
ncbi:MAG: hypothetical protein LUC43_00800 [Burkholderiales bacterium]|nr:hypothetical protein [Burkholderiales bacterium]